MRFRLDGDSFESVALLFWAAYTYHSKASMRYRRKPVHPKRRELARTISKMRPHGPTTTTKLFTVCQETEAANSNVKVALLKIQKPVNSVAA